MFTAPDAMVLVVDDINTNLKVAEGLLSPYGVQVDLCKSGMEAIEAVQTNRYDLIFMDHRMPEMDGVEATQHIRTMGGGEPFYADVPIIALTANAISGMEEIFLKNGFNDFMSKPIDTVKLNAILERWIPKTKQQGMLKERAGSYAAKQKYVQDEIKIEGLDVALGVSRIGGKIEYYLETLATFHEDALIKIDEIKTCLEAGDLSLYTTYVHAMKSASANVGAIELSDAAMALETAGEQEDFAYIKTHNDKFLLDLELLLDNIGKALASRNRGKEQNTLDKGLLISELMQLRNAIDTMNGGVIRSSIDSLQKLTDSHKVSATVSEISKNVLLAEYDVAISLIESLLQEAKA
jgi:CheY-like chemotaxis protein